jgi:hypothetical protein
MRSILRRTVRLLVAGALAGSLLFVGSPAPVHAAGLAVKASPAGCKTYIFKGNFFPNPVRRLRWGPDLKFEADYYGEDQDGAFVSADLHLEAWNSAGQLVIDNDLGTIDSSNPGQRFVVADTTAYPNGLYTVRLTATSEVCGSKSISETVIFAR